jgi:hydrogenase nickel incorporation protein HypA/HybF
VHELGLAESIVSTAVAASPAPPERIAAIAVDVGPLSAANPSSLEFWMRMVLDSRGMHHTRVDLAATPARVRCECGRVYESRDFFSPCPDCGSFDRELLAGGDVTIRHLEVDDE